MADIILLSQVSHPVGLREIAKAVSDVAARELDQDVQALAEACRMRGMTALDFLRDWYRLRMASELAMPWIEPETLETYERVSTLYCSTVWDARSAQSKIARLFSMFERYRSGLPSDSFAIDRASGAIVDRQK